jgi:hypothetical protein
MGQSQDLFERSLILVQLDGDRVRLWKKSAEVSLLYLRDLPVDRSTNRHRARWEIRNDFEIG